MAKRKQRHRPAAGIEVVYEDERCSAIALDVPISPPAPVVQVYAKPHHDLLFCAFSVGLLFKCKRCRREDLLGWDQYNRRLQANEPPYHVLCTQIGHTWIVQADEPIPKHLKAYKIYTLTGDDVELIASIATYIHNRRC
jgi:hypothetical protein